MRFMHFVRPWPRFFRTAPTAPPVAEDPVAALDSAAHEVIIATALRGGEEGLRAAAVRKLPDGDVLRHLAGLRAGTAADIPASLQRIAQQRTAQLIDDGAIDFPRLCVTTGTSSAVLAIAGLCSNPAYLSHALRSIDDPQRLARLVIEGSSGRLRQLAAQSIEDSTVLRQLLKQVRGKDKSVYRIIKHKCDGLRAEEQRIAQAESDTRALCTALERHSHRTYDALYASSFERLNERWRSLATQAAPQLRERALAASERCQQVIAGHLRQVAAQAAEESRQSALRAARQEADAQAAQEAQRRNEALALQATEAAQVREAEEKVRAERLAAEALGLRQIGGLIAKAHGALRDGNTGRAAGLRRAIEEKLPTVPAVPAYLANQVQQLDVALSELREWKDYAVAPKRAELIEQMEALIGSSEEPRALADRIKGLQQEWKTISRGIVSDSAADWQRFHQASQSAYQPCHEYFEAQARLRQANLESRAGVLARLLAFETAQSGEHPDWRAVAAVLREARQEWRQYSPLDRVAGRAVQEGFDASIGRMQGRLDAWYAQNVAAKKALIQRAQHLYAEEDSREAMEAVKSLRREWKEVGAVPRDQEQPLWEEFREQCDAIYQKRQQAYAQYKAGLEANKARAVALCEQAEQAATLSGPALLEGVGQISQWRAAFEGLTELPRAERALQDRFERALNLCQAKVSQQRAREQEQSFINLLEAARRIHTYGWALAQGAASADREALKQAAETFIAGVQQWPKGGAAALKDAWETADAAAPCDTAAHEAALRTLCIRSEILSDLPTPPEDQALRRDYQLQRLVQRMGQRTEAKDDELHALALEWVRVGFVAADRYEPLAARFLRCR